MHKVTLLFEIESLKGNCRRGVTYLVEPCGGVNKLGLADTFL
jgi:hypothetical protein